jgi:hypothetical protein
MRRRRGLIFSNVDGASRPSSTVIDPNANILVSNAAVVGASYHPSSTVNDPYPNILPNADLIPIVGASHRPSSKDPTGSSSDPVMEQPPQDGIASPNPHIPHPSSTVSLPVSTLPSGRHIPTVNDAILATPGPSTASESELAAEEARFLRSLYASNAPANEIAELMQAMRARKDNSGMTNASG